MSFASKYNSGSKFNIDTKGYPYVKLSDLDPNKVYTLSGFFINTKGDYEPHPVFIVDKTLIDIPPHLTQTCKEIEQDSEAVKEIIAGKVGFKLRPYTDRKGKERNSIEWVDI